MIYNQITNNETTPILYQDVVIENGIYYANHYDRAQKNSYLQPLGNAVFLTQKLINLDDYKQFFQLKFSDCNGGSYEQLYFSRKKVNAKEVLELADYGVMVDEFKAKFLAHSILNQEQDENLPIAYIHKKLGFKKINDKVVFLGDKGYNIDSVYHGELQINPTGSFKTWKKMIKEEVVGHIPLETIFSIGVGGIIKDYLKNEIDSTNLFAHLIGDSSSGKTTAGLLAVSLGASPNIADKSFVFTCNSTQNSIMNSIPNAYPTLLDEGNQLWGDKTPFLYAIADGKEKDRLSKEIERRETNTFNTSIFLTSEKSIVDTCEQTTGLRVRILEFINVDWTKSANSSDRIKSVVKNNYGFALPIIVNSLIKEDKEEFINWYNEMCDGICDSMREKNQFNDFSKRLSKIYALIICGSELCNSLFSFQFDSEAILDFLLEHNMLKDEETADIGLRAYSRILEYVEMHSINFPKVCKKARIREDMIFGSNCSNIEGIIKDDDVYLLEQTFKKILLSAGFSEPKVVAKKLKQQGILIPEADDRYKTRFTLPNSTTKLSGYRIRIKE